jgi:hypothetical protein
VQIIKFFSLLFFPKKTVRLERRVVVMKNKWMFSIFSMIMVLSLVLAACQPAPTPTPEQPTEQPTEQPAHEAAPEYKAIWDGTKSVKASDCGYGGILKEIAAVDPLQ